jgi:hypothetical protein
VELVAAVNEFDHWIGILRDERALGRAPMQAREASPFAKVEAIALAYFPQFKE